MKTSELLSDQVARRLVGEHKLAKSAAFDPMLLLALVSIAISAARLALECSRGDRTKAAAWLRSPGLWGRWKLRGLANQELSKRGLSKYSSEVRGAILSSLPNEERAISLLGEVNDAG